MIPTTGYNGSRHPAVVALKHWIKKLPFFWELDFYRRKIYDSPLFDFSIEPLAGILAEWPGALIIDNTNRCNAKCAWCPQSELDDLGAMKMDLYRKIIDDYATRGGVVRFGTFGEPLMDKTFEEKIRYLKKYPSIRKIEVVTNAFFLNEKIVPALLECGVDVEISLDELEKKTFEDVKQMSYDVVRGNILAFLEQNDAREKPVNVSFRIKSSLSREATVAHELFAKIAGRRGCTIELTPIEEDSITNWAGRFDKNSFYQEHMGGKPIVQKHNNKSYNKINTAPCNQPWKWMVIYWDGRVVLCCVDMFATTAFGDLNKQSIAEVWNGPAINEVRAKMRQRKRFEIPLCTDCDLHLSWQYLKVYYNLPGAGASIYKEDRPFIG